MRQALLLTCLLLFGNTVFCQDSKNRVEITKIQKPSSSTGSELSSVNNQILAYDRKINYFESHLEEKKLALENGTLLKLQSERDSLILISIQLQKTVESKSVGTKNTQLTKVNTEGSESIEHIDSVIAAIDSKVAWVKQDQTENQKALESGYYVMMETQKAKLLEKRKELVGLQNSDK